MVIKGLSGAEKLTNREMQQAISPASEKVTSISAEDEFTWRFVPVATSYFGGLWEGACKIGRAPVEMCAALVICDGRRDEISL